MNKDLLSLARLSVSEISELLCLAEVFRSGGGIPDLRGTIACNLFFESSTRTQYSFNVAEERLGMRVVSFNPASSSLNKQESFYDTVKTFDSFGVQALVIRHGQNEYYRELEGHINASLLNGGDGTGNHPTQSLLDLLTIEQEFGGFGGLKCAIIGDIRHSRVAHTNCEVMTRLGMQVVTSGPMEYREEGYPYEDFETALSTSDIVMLLRVQHERHADGSGFSNESYHRQYGLTAQRADRMKKGAIIMHPAPVNRGVELADEMMEHPRSRIFKQMENGVYVRMASIVKALEAKGACGLAQEKARLA